MVPRVKQLTVVIAHERATARVGARLALESGGIHVVAEAADAEEAVAMTLRHRPDVCLLSTGLPGSGIIATDQISRLTDTKTVVLSRSTDELFDALRAGALGYLPATTPVARLPDAIRGVAEGQAALPRELTARLIREFRETGGRRRSYTSSSGDIVVLTPREYEVLQYLRRGDQTREIADSLGISEVTVRRHISSVERKLGVADRRSALNVLRLSD